MVLAVFDGVWWFHIFFPGPFVPHSFLSPSLPSFDLLFHLLRPPLFPMDARGQSKVLLSVSLSSPDLFHMVLRYVNWGPTEVLGRVSVVENHWSLYCGNCECWGRDFLLSLSARLLLLCPLWKLQSSVSTSASCAGKLTSCHVIWVWWCMCVCCGMGCNLVFGSAGSSPPSGPQVSLGSYY